MMLLTEGQMSHQKPAALLFSKLPKAKELPADKGCDSDWFHDALPNRGIDPWISPTANHKVQHGYDKQLSRQRHKIENLFDRLKDWRRVATGHLEEPAVFGLTAARRV